MAVRIEKYLEIREELNQRATLVAVSKVRSVAEIMELYELGHRDFGENYVQELIEKHMMLPQDIRWHFIGHLQSNKVKLIAPFIYLVHGVDSFKLLTEIDKQGRRSHRTISCLLQVHIAQEETKFGLSEAELDELIMGISQTRDETHEFRNISIEGLMGMASNIDDVEKLDAEFEYLNTLYDKYATIKHPAVRFKTLSTGMSGDYKIALRHGSNMVRIGSLLFGARQYPSG